MSAAVMPPQFNYASLSRPDAEFLREKTGEIRELARTATEGILRLGAALAEVRERLEYGQFESWLAAEFNWSRRTAYNLINVHEAFGSANFAQLQVDISALYLLAAPSTPAEVREVVIERAKQGERITHADAKQAIREITPAVERSIKQTIAAVIEAPAEPEEETEPEPQVSTPSNYYPDLLAVNTLEDFLKSIKGYSPQKMVELLDFSYKRHITKEVLSRAAAYLQEVADAR